MDNKKMDHTLLTSLKHGFKKRLFAGITLITFFLQSIAPAYAAALSAGEIQDAIDAMADVEFNASGSPYFYQTPDYVTANTSSYPDIKWLFEKLRTTNKSALQEPVPTPVAVGDITIFVPAHVMGKPVGDTYVQSRYVRDQIQQLLKRNIINAGQYADNANLEYEQIKRLYNQAFIYAGLSSTTEKFGDPITKFDRYTSTYDMVWPERRIINGQSVLVPVVYLTAATVDAESVDKHTIEFGGDVNLTGLDIKNVDISFRSNFINIANEFTSKESNITFSDDVQVIVGGKLSLLSSVIQANNNLAIEAHSIDARTLVQHFDLGDRSGSFYGEITSISANGNIYLKSKTDAILQGVRVNAGDEIVIYAEGNIYIGGIEFTTSFDGKENGYSVQRTAIDYLQSSLTAEDNIKLIANGTITLDAAEIVSTNGHLEILAGLGITVQDHLEQFQYQKKGKFGKRKITESGYQTFAIRSLLDAGKGVKLNSQFGDINLKAVDIRSKDGTTVTASNGKVNLLLTKENDHYNYQSVKKGLLTTKVKTKGHENETAITNTVIGGFQVEAAQGVYVEYEGMSGESCDDFVAENKTNPVVGLDQCAVANIEAIAKIDGMGWMKTILDDAEQNPDLYNWKEIKIASKSWSDSKTSLSPAAMAIITIVVAAYAGPAATGIIGGVGGTAASAAMAAGLSALITQGTMATINGLINDGKFEEAFKELDNDETWRNLAISMVTAGALAQIDASFFSDIKPDDITASLLDDVTGKLSLTGQATQALVNATASAGISTLINKGDFSDLGTALAQSLAQKGIAEIGKYAANQIGEAWDIDKADGFDTAMKYALHAGAGCFIGVATAANQNNQTEEDGCSYGALGAVTGELVGSIHKSKTKEEVEEAQGAINDMMEKDKELIAKLAAPCSGGQTTACGMSNAQISAVLQNENTQYTHYQKQINDLRQSGVDLARFSGALASMLAGADAAGVNVAADTGQNAAENNALFLLAIPFIIKAIDIALTLDELYDAYKDISKAYAKGDAEGEQALADFIEASAGNAALEKIIEKLIPGASIAKAMSNSEILQAIRGWGENGLETLTNAIQKADPRDTSLRDAFNDKAAKGVESGELPSGLLVHSYNPLDREVIARILNRGHKNRPVKGDPDWPYTEAFEAEHLARFDNGGVRIYRPHTKPNGDITIGQEDMYIMPRDELNSLIETTKGDLGALEKALGFKTGELSGGEYKIAFLDDVNTKVSLPTGNEAGANEKWVPGGFTSGGVPEATYSGSTQEKDYITQTLSEFFGN